MTLPQQSNPAPAGREPVFNLSAVVVAIIAGCTLVHLVRGYALTPAQDFEFLLRTAFIPIRYSGQFEIDFFAWTSPVTYSLIHGDFIHLLINMIWLAAFGSPLANRIGTIRFLAFWVFTSVAAVLLHYAVHAGDQAMVVGASGAVSGMMAAAARFGFSVDRSARRPAFAGRRLPLAAVFRRRNVVVFLGAWFAINLIAGFGYLVPGDDRSIAWEAHIGGFLAGFFGLAMFDRGQVAQNGQRF
ncbi:MAG: rhomboid family intramembrane serine protease [Rhizobiaceae bacterium]